MRVFAKVSLCASVCGFSLVMATSANAESAAGNSSTNADSANGIAEIVVTANKREQKLNDVGLSVAVLGAQSLQQQQVSSLQDIAKAVPGLSYTQGITGSPVYTLRGVGFYESSLAAFPSVSVYQDEQPLAFPAVTAHSAFDLERIEVLKGPQGTLFGENSTGGAINYIAAKPTDSFKAGGSLSYGRFNQVVAEGYVSGPVSNTLAVRLAVRSETADGWQYSVSRPGDTNGRAENFEGRFTASFKPSSTARFLLTITGWKDKGETEAGQYIALQPNRVGYVPTQVTSAAFTPETDRAADWSTSSFFRPDQKVPFRDNSMLQASLRGAVDVGTIGTITSLTNYIHYSQFSGTDFAGFPINVFAIPYNPGKIDEFNQEIRFSNDAHSSLRYVIGGNFEKDVVDEQVGNQYTYTSANEYFGDVFNAPFQVSLLTSEQKITNYAAFGNVEYDPISNITLKGGVRYNNAKNQDYSCEVDPAGPTYYAGNLLNFFADALSGNPKLAGPYTAGQCFMLNVSTGPNYQAVDPSRPIYAPGAYNGVLHEHNVSWHGGVDYKPRQGLLFYANISKGYKAGSFPVINGTTFAQDLPVKQESVLAYEVGFKATLFDHKVQLNGAGFHYEYDNKQLRTKVLDPVFGQLDAIQNIPKSHVTGFEIETTLHPVAGLALDIAYTYLDAKIDQYVGVDAGGDAGVNFAGSRIPFTPKNQLSISANYEQPISATLKGFIGASLNYRSDTVSVVGGDVNPASVVATAPGVNCVYCIGAYTTVDGQIGIKAANDSWKVFIWGKNIFNKYYWTNVVSDYDTVSRFAGMPATYGMTVAFKF
jgi:iron complex outermembrane recepter protein